MSWTVWIFARKSEAFALRSTMDCASGSFLAPGAIWGADLPQEIRSMLLHVCSESCGLRSNLRIFGIRRGILLGF